MTMYSATRHARQPSDTPGWLQRLLGSAGPTPDPIIELTTRLTLVEGAQAKADQERAGLIEANARLEERIKIADERFIRERATTAQQAETIADLRATLANLNTVLAGHTAEFLSFSDTIGSLKQQNADQHARMVVMRDTITELQAKLQVMGEQLREMPSLRHQVQKLILTAEVWRRYAEQLRHQLGDAAPELPIVPAIGEDVGK